jgi:hypothetical protein
MKRIKLWVASWPAATGLLVVVVTVIVAACKTGGSSGY